MQQILSSVGKKETQITQLLCPDKQKHKNVKNFWNFHGCFGSALIMWFVSVKFNSPYYSQSATNMNKQTSAEMTVTIFGNHCLTCVSSFWYGSRTLCLYGGGWIYDLWSTLQPATRGRPWRFGSRLSVCTVMSVHFRSDLFRTPR